MFQVLIVSAGLVLGAQKPLPVNRQTPQSQTQNKDREAEQAAQSAAAADIAKENAENAERYAYYKAHHEEYLHAVLAPANLSNLILAGLGVFGGLIALVTVLVVKRQTDLQAAALKQWVDVRVIKLVDEGDGVDALGSPLPSREITLWLEVVNSTPYPLTVTKVKPLAFAGGGEPSILWESFDWAGGITLPPVRADGKHGAVFSIALTLDENMFAKYENGRLELVVGGIVRFKPAVGRKQTQAFDMPICCSPFTVKLLPSVGELAKRTRGPWEWREKPKKQKAN